MQIQGITLKVQDRTQRHVVLKRGPPAATVPTMGAVQRAATATAGTMSGIGIPAAPHGNAGRDVRCKAST